MNIVYRLLPVIFALVLFGQPINAFAVEPPTYPQPAYPTDTPFPVKPKPDRVILLHGIGRTSYSMAEIARKIKLEGFEPMNIGYPSTRDTLAKIIHDLYDRYDHIIDDEERVVHFACYSLGCLVTRGIIEQHRPARLGRVVMLGPPNQGSEMADWLRDHDLSNWLFGPNLPQLGTANRRMLLKLIGDSADYELGIIAGNDWIDPVGAHIIPGDDDGRVSVARTMLPGMKEHLVMEASHTGLITNDEVIAQAIHFIKHGIFQREPD